MRKLKTKAKNRAKYLIVGFSNREHAKHLQESFERIIERATRAAFLIFHVV